MESTFPEFLDGVVALSPQPPTPHQRLSMPLYPPPSLPQGRRAILQLN